MSEFTYKEYLPLNARIIIDYNQKKGEKVKFSYPKEMEYKKAVWKSGYPTINGFWLVLNIQFFMYVLVPFFIIRWISDYYHIFGLQTATGLIIDTHLIAIGIVEIFTVPIIVTFYLSRNKEKLSTWIPKMGYLSGKLLGFLKEMDFTPKDITNENKAIIPIFSNVTLKWFPDGDFNKYLEKIEILELPFHYKIRFFWWLKKWKALQNDYLFRAVFHFSQKPENGSMKVEFI